MKLTPRLLREAKPGPAKEVLKGGKVLSGVGIAFNG